MIKYKSPDCISKKELSDVCNELFPSPKENDFLAKLQKYESRYTHEKVFEEINNEKTSPPDAIVIGGKELQENEEVEVVDIF